MSGTSAIASPVAEDLDDVSFRANDETPAEYRQRESWAKQEAKTRADLDGDKRAAVYRRLVTLSPLLTATESRFLCTLTYQWGRDLENCFPSRSTIDDALPRTKRERRKDKPWRVEALLRSCERKGFIQRVHLTRDESGALFEVAGGQFISNVGIQFLLPEGVITPEARAWSGPRVWSNRLYAKKAK